MAVGGKTDIDSDIIAMLEMWDMKVEPLRVATKLWAQQQAAKERARQDHLETLLATNPDMVTSKLTNPRTWAQLQRANRNSGGPSEWEYATINKLCSGPRQLAATACATCSLLGYKPSSTASAAPGLEQDGQNRRSACCDMSSTCTYNPGLWRQC